MYTLDRYIVKEYMQRYFANNYHHFAKEIGIDKSHLHRFVNHNIGCGARLIMGLYGLCEIYGWDYKSFLKQEGYDSDRL